MLSRFGIEASQAAQYVIAFAIILVLVALLGLVLRRVTGGRLMLPGQDRARARQPRLGVVDIYDLDRQRQLILLRRDNVEHLLLIGGPNDVVIETNIVRVAGARLPVPAAEPSSERTEPSFDRQPEPTRPPVDQPGRPSIEAQLAARLDAMIGRPSSSDSGATRELAPAASTTAPTKARVESALKPDAVTLSPPAAPRANRAEPAVPDRQTPVSPMRPSGPPLRSAPAPTRPGPTSTSETRQPEQPRPAPVRPAGPPIPPSPEPGPGAAVLSDMAKQLEEALKRPTSPSAQPSPPATEPDGSGVSVSSPVSVYGPPPQSGPPAPPARTTEQPPQQEQAQPVPPPPPPSPAPQAAPQPRKVDDPFSVEEIEAEFARLLGRPINPKDGA